MTLLDDQPWRLHAACRDEPMATFFPTKDQDTTAIVARARMICSGCPVRDPCLQYALSDPLTLGVWGGTTWRERNQMRARRRRLVA